MYILDYRVACDIFVFNTTDKKHPGNNLTEPSPNKNKEGTPWNTAVPTSTALNTIVASKTHLHTLPEHHNKT